MFIPEQIDSCVFSYLDNVYQFHYDPEDNTIEFECFDNTKEPADDMSLLKRLVELSEQQMK